LNFSLKEAMLPSQRHFVALFSLFSLCFDFENTEHTIPINVIPGVEKRGAIRRLSDDDYATTKLESTEKQKTR